MNRARDFWYAFDNRYIPNPNVMPLYLDCNLYKPNPVGGQPILNLDWMFLSLKERMQTNPSDYEQLFLTEVTKYENGIKKLANDQLGIIHKYLKDSNEIQQAFELFGQGVLYDERRRNVHQMQGRFPHDMVGYSRWHGFARATVSVGGDSNFWLNLDRCLLLAYLIQSELKPLDSKPNNPSMDQERLDEYRSSCMALEFKDLDGAFGYYF